MDEQWYQNYVLLALRLDKILRSQSAQPFVDAYYGPSAWKTQVESEREVPLDNIIKLAADLRTSLSSQQYTAAHQRHLEKQLRALETVARKLNGEDFTLQEEVQNCFDISPRWIPEAEFEQAHSWLDEILPGAGDISTRALAWRKRYELPQEKYYLLPQLVELMIAEARARTSAFVDLPPEEKIEVRVVRGKPTGGACWYLGNYQSLIEINADLPIALNTLLDLICHEGYPGHHTEATLKELHLYRKQGYLDQSVLPLISPLCLIAEGIATLAKEVIFSAEEAEKWLAQHIYPQVGLTIEPIDAEKFAQASDILEGVRGNAAFLLREGRSEAEVRQYIQKYMLVSEDRADKALQFLKVPFLDAYVFTYFYGKKLMRPWLEGPDKLKVFRRFLSEQIVPSDLVALSS
ncbi:hypothetical protein EPA93_23705 [Ktedonosporobacter rubrisoli]|uniref:DUF885 domain-containing protein n=1 Tax=Ktedonosporobacter rubrisoli TaxID=2509675 RepID=A0A4P6JV51_KTERU|nr:hypothetical protein [Ktedonosporobacter rubrisoli]QBD78826.1 hypothetical protein EPA93_23705 [Ktedonosporobacter rubrisoli]